MDIFEEMRKGSFAVEFENEQQHEEFHRFCMENNIGHLNIENSSVRWDGRDFKSYSTFPKFYRNPENMRRFGISRVFLYSELFQDIDFV